MSTTPPAHTAGPFGLTDEQTDIARMVRAFADEEIAPHAIDWDEREHFPRDVLVHAAGLGLGRFTPARTTAAPA